MMEPHGPVADRQGRPDVLAPSEQTAAADRVLAAIPAGVAEQIRKAFVALHLLYAENPEGGLEQGLHFIKSCKGHIVRMTSG